MSHTFPDGRAANLTLPWAVGLLALSQTVGYGTIFYSYAIVAPAMAREFGAPASLPFTVISVAFLIAGLSGPWIGRVIDRVGGPRVMRAGSLAVAAIYLGLAMAPGIITAAGLTILLQVVGVTVLYGAAFPTLALFGRERGKRGIIWLGLIGGFASSIFWPLTGWLVPEFGWRATFGMFAAMHLLIALPAHRVLAHRPIPDVAEVAARSEGAQPDRAVPRRLAFWLIAGAFGLTGVVSTALLVHMTPLLQRIVPGPEAYSAAALAGPAMAGSRLAEVLIWPRAHPIWSAIISAAAFPTALAALIVAPLLGSAPLATACLFAVLYGIGHGLGVTSAGTLPLRVFGLSRYAETLGRIGAVRVILGATGPALLAWGLAAPAPTMALVAGLLLSLAGLAPLLVLALLLFLPETSAGATR